MPELRRILVATDLSAPARRAADRAAQIAQSASASLALVHAVSGSALDELRRWIDSGGETNESLVDEVRDRLHALALDLSGHYAIPVEDDVVIGHPVGEIVRAAAERGADLIVTGTLGSGFLRNRFVGSTAERIVRRAAQSVLMVRSAPRGPYRRVLVAVDFSAWSLSSVEAARRVAPDAHLVLLHAIAPPLAAVLGRLEVNARVTGDFRTAQHREAMAQLESLAAEAKLAHGTWTAVAPHGSDAWAEIVRHEQELDCELVVLGKQGRNAVEDLLLGSTTNRVIGESTVDVLVSTQRAA